MALDARIHVRGNADVQLRNTSRRVTDAARSAMLRAADRIVKLAKLQAPHDTGALEESIRIERTYGERRRLQIDIIAGGNVMVESQGRMIDLNQYAFEIHERYEEIHPKPGRNTLAKMQANPGVQIGSGFLSRAVAKERAKLETYLIDAIDRAIPE